MREVNSKKKKEKIAALAQNNKNEKWFNFFILISQLCNFLCNQHLLSLFPPFEWLTNNSASLKVENERERKGKKIKIQLMMLKNYQKGKREWDEMMKKMQTSWKEHSVRDLILLLEKKEWKDVRQPAVQLVEIFRSRLGSLRFSEGECLWRKAKKFWQGAKVFAENIIFLFLFQ